MGLFSRRRDDATTDSDESILGRDPGDDDLDEAAPGPWDLSELPEDQEEVPEAQSPISTMPVRRPRLAASRAMPAPVTPPPTTRTSSPSSPLMAARARVR